MSETPEKKHPWAKYKGRPVAPSPLNERPAVAALGPKLKPAEPLAVKLTPMEPVAVIAPVAAAGAGSATGVVASPVVVAPLIPKGVPTLGPDAGPVAPTPTQAPRAATEKVAQVKTAPTPLRSVVALKAVPAAKPVARAPLVDHTRAAKAESKPGEGLKANAGPVPAATAAKGPVVAKFENENFSATGAEAKKIGDAEPSMRPEISAEMADTLAQLDDFQTAPGWPAAMKKYSRPPGQGRLAWLGLAVRDSVRHRRESGRRLAAWWGRWRRTASFQVLVAFVAIYGVLAYMRAPSDVVVERSRHAEEIGFLQDFLKSYCKAGGLVLAEKPHGGAELYPRGMVLKGEALAAFGRTPVGEVFTTTATGAGGNPLLGFYGFPPIYAGGSYFNLERKFNFSLYKCTYLIRKDSETAGVMLMARVEMAK